MKLKRSLYAPVAVAFIGLVSGGWLLQKGASPDRNVYFQARLFEEVLHHISDRFVEERQPSDLYRMAVDGLLRELGDPHSTFMTPEEYEELRVQTEGDYGGLGIEIAVRDGWITVLSPMPGTPAERAGLQAGDRIVEVEDESTRGWSDDRAVAELRGPQGSTVSIRVSRVGVDELIPFTIERAEIHVPSVPVSYMLDGGIGYVELTAFNETAAEDLAAAIRKLQAEGMDRLILDMRRNPGGLLDMGLEVADLFLPRQAGVLETRSRTPGQTQEFLAVREEVFADIPLVVLVGRRSASAAEIVAGALQDHDRALLLGETSFGKGSVQTLYRLPGGYVLKLTTARWYTPSGRSIQKPYGIGLEMPEAVDTETLDAPSAAEKQEQGVEIYTTDGGRKVLGGGGITPDVIIMDTLTTAEQRFIRAVQADWSTFNNVLYDYAVAYTHEHPRLEPGFPVTASVLDGFYDVLAESGVDVPRTVLAEASPFLRRRLAQEISTAAFDKVEGWKRLTAEDAEVQLAVELLRRASGQADLFPLANRVARERGLMLGFTEAMEAAGNSRP